MQIRAYRLYAGCLWLTALCALLMPCKTLYAGKLDAFETSANQVSPSRSSSSGCSRHSHNCVGNVLGEVIVEVVGYSFIYGGVSSWARVDPDWDDELMDGVVPRTTGEPALPFARFDFGFQNVQSDVDAYDYRVLGTLGYTSLKVGYRWVSSPGVSLDGPYAGVSVHF